MTQKGHNFGAQIRKTFSGSSPPIA